MAFPVAAAQDKAGATARVNAMSKERILTMRLNLARGRRKALKTHSGLSRRAQPNTPYRARVTDSNSMP